MITMLDVVGVVKTSLSVVASYGGVKVAEAVIMQAISDEESKKLFVKIGTVCLTGAAGVIAAKYMASTVDEVVKISTEVANSGKMALAKIKKK